MKRMRWWIGRTQLGWPGAAAICLILLAASAQVFLLRPLQGSYDTGPAVPVREAGPPLPAANEPRHFHGRFEGAVVPRQLASLNRIAAAHGIALAHAEYHVLNEGEAGLHRYQVTLPIEAPYPAIRAFLGDVLEQLPTAALEQVAFERKRIGASAVEAQIRLTLYVEP